MPVSDPIGDMLTRIRNAQMRKKATVSTPGSKLRKRVLDVLANHATDRGGRRETRLEKKSIYHFADILGNTSVT